MRRFLGGAFAALLTASSTVCAVQAASAAPAHVDSAYFNGLNWRSIGPYRGGRALAVAGVPGEPDHFYFGSVDGGVWETTNAGRTWNPIFDAESSPSIGAIAVAPSDKHTIYLGTGEADMRSDIAYGNGMFKSTDGGKTWTHIGLDDTRQIGKIVVDPRDANVVYVAALGHQYGPNAERGVFKSIDGGATWTKVLYKNDDTGAIDLAMNPQDPNVVYASLWQTRRPPWNVYPPSSGPGGGLYKTSDGGKTWTQLKNGLPSKVGHVGLATSAANPSRVYAQIDTGADVARGGVYRSDDNGATWTHLAGGEDQVRLWKRGWYFGGITADPKNADVVYVMNTATYRSNDGGKSFVAIKGSPGGDDYHTLWIEPDDSNRMILGGDQGVVISVDGAQTWSSWLNQPTAQIYHVATDDRFPYWVYGAQQDSGAIAVPSQSIHEHITWHDWRTMDVGGESGTIAPNPGHAGKLFGSFGTYEDLDTGWEQTIDATLKYPDTVWRSTWTTPIVVSPADKKTLYTSHQQVFRSRDAGNSWTIVSPDLTRQGANVNRPANLDAPTLADSSGLPRRGVVYALAPSALDAQLMWAGTDDGYVWITRDGGGHWTNVTPPQLTAWSKVGIIDASRFDTKTAYIAVDRHRLDDLKPYIYRTHDGGTTWTPIANGIPVGSFVNAVRADPKTRGLLYAATERGMYVSFDDGAHWQTLQRNLPVTSVRDIDVHGDDLVIATHGRGFYIMDNITPLRQMAAAVAADSAYLFTPATTYRVRRAGGVGGGIADESTPVQPDEPQAENPKLGVYIDYVLRGAGSPVTLDILDASGTMIRSWSSSDKPQVTDPSTVDLAPRWITSDAVLPSGAGAHRFVWAFQVKDNDGALAPPGRYTVRLRTGGTTESRSFELLRDPRIAVTDADLRAQYALANQITDRLHEIAAAQARGKDLLKSATLTAAQKRSLQTEILGEVPAVNPSDSVGKPPQDFRTLRYLKDAYDNLWAAVESADAAPTADMHAAFAKLNATLSATLANLRRM